MTVPSPTDDDLLLDDDELLADDEPASAAASPSRLQPWRVLVVDDEPDVLLMTKLALQGLVVDGRPVQLLMATSAAQAKTILQSDDDIAVAIIDVIMEDVTAGLQLVRWIREVHLDSIIRLVLRTGQPGNAPEALVTSEFDIHDYLGKSETTARRLLTCMTGAIRAWRDLCTIHRQHIGLQRALQAVGELFDTSGIAPLLAAILEQVTGLLTPRRSSLLFVAPESLVGRPQRPHVVLAATGRYENAVGQSLDAVLPDAVREQIWSALQFSSSAEVENLVCYAFGVAPDIRPVLLVDGGPMLPWERELVELYCHAATLALRNRRMWDQQVTWFRALERFVPRELLTLVGKRDLREIRAGDSRVAPMTVCFVDVRAFSQLVVDRGSSAAFVMLNRLFGELGHLIFEYGGVIEKYLGDGALILFPDGPETAAQAARAMQQRCAELRAHPTQPLPLRIGIGLHTGPIIIGAVGHDERMDISVVSQVVNLAARVQETARNLQCDIVVTDELREGLPAKVREAMRPVLTHELRGDHRSRMLWEDFGHLPDAVRTQRATTVPLLDAVSRLAALDVAESTEQALAQIDAALASQHAHDATLVALRRLLVGRIRSAGREVEP
jgi:class 3 adenylate cyclase